MRSKKWGIGFIKVNKTVTIYIDLKGAGLE